MGASIFDEIAAKCRAEMKLLDDLDKHYSVDRLRSLNMERAAEMLEAICHQYDERKIPAKYIKRVISKIDDPGLIGFLGKRIPMVALQEIEARLLPKSDLDEK